MRRRLALIGLLIFTCGDNALAQQSPPADNVTVIRWQCRLQRRFHGSDVLGGPPLYTETAHHETVDMLMNAREEVLTIDGFSARRFIVENATYHFTRGAIRVIPETGSPFLIAAPVNASFQFGAGDFVQPLSPDVQKLLTGNRRTVEKLRRDLAAAERRRGEAAADEAANIRQDIHQAEMELKFQEFTSTSQDLFFNSWETDEKIGASASLNLPALKYRPVEWSLAGGPLNAGPWRQGPLKPPEERSHGMANSASVEGKPGQTTFVSVPERRGGSNVSERAVFTRTPSDIPPNEDYDLIVELKNYSQWTPSANHDPAKPGDPLLPVRARVVVRGSGSTPTDGIVSRFTFELVGTSAEPGVAINWPPVERAGYDPDLRFDADPNFAEVNVLDPRGQRAEVTGSMTRAQAVISCYDWGAHGYLVVTAQLHDGRILMGHLQGQPQLMYIPVPKRREGSKIADRARDANAMNAADLADDDDAERRPPGRSDGDGLTFYEEYRGYYMNGEHERGDVHTKDFFVCSKIGPVTERGILMFQKASKLAVHYKLREEDIGSDPGDNYVINFNTSRGGVKQHGVWMEYGPPSESAHAAETQYRNGSPARGSRSPRHVAKIVVRPPTPSGAGGQSSGQGQPNLVFDITIAHELGHAVNIQHHGDPDITAQAWTVHREPNKLPRFKENGRLIRVLNEDGRELFPAPQLQGSLTMSLVTANGGRHSGVDTCFMRYFIAGAYKSKTAANDRYIVTGEPRGQSLCDTGAGSGINAGNRRPQSRYGNATNGNCVSQIRIKDQ